MTAALFFAFVTGFLAVITAALLAVFTARLTESRLSAEAALKKVQALKSSNPDAPVEAYLAAIGQLPASKYSDELHETLFTAGVRRRVIVEVPIADDPFSHVRVSESLPPQESVPREAGRIVLTEREKEVLRLVADGYQNEQIARRLSVNQREIRKMVSDLLARFSAQPT
jgi:DNA-binding NarL/FixJ family response regulator